MYNLLIAIAAGLLAFLLAGYGLGGGSLNVWYGLLPGLIALVVVYVLLARRTFKQVEEIARRAESVFQGRDTGRMIEVLESARPLGKWQFLVEPQIDAQIGSIYFLTKEFSKAEGYLKKGYSRNWQSQMQLGVLYFKHRDYDRMEEVFAQAVKSNKSQPLLWNVYAYCYWDRGLGDKAISILNEAVKHVGEDEKTKQNLLALQNKRRMKMRGWDMMWYSLHLDRPPAPQVKQPQPTFRR